MELLADTSGVVMWCVVAIIYENGVPWRVLGDCWWLGCISKSLCDFLSCRICKGFPLPHRHVPGRACVGLVACVMGTWRGLSSCRRLDLSHVDLLLLVWMSESRLCFPFCDDGH